MWIVVTVVPSVDLFAVCDLEWVECWVAARTSCGVGPVSQNTLIPRNDYVENTIPDLIDSTLFTKKGIDYIRQQRLSGWSTVVHLEKNS